MAIAALGHYRDAKADAGAERLSGNINTTMEMDHAGHSRDDERSPGYHG